MLASHLSDRERIPSHLHLSKAERNCYIPFRCGLGVVWSSVGLCVAIDRRTFTLRIYNATSLRSEHEPSGRDVDEKENDFNADTEDRLSRRAGERIAIAMVGDDRESREAECENAGNDCGLS